MSKAHVTLRRLPGPSFTMGHQQVLRADGQSNREQRRARMRYWPRQHRLHFAGFGRWRRHWYVRRDEWSVD